MGKDEFNQALKESKQVREALTLLGLAEVEDLFDKIDIDNSGVMTVPEFIEGVFMLKKGGEVATSADVTTVYTHVCSVQDELASLHEKLLEFQGETSGRMESVLRDTAEIRSILAAGAGVTVGAKGAGGREAGFGGPGSVSSAAELAQNGAPVEGFAPEPRGGPEGANVAAEAVRLLAKELVVWRKEKDRELEALAKKLDGMEGLFRAAQQLSNSKGLFGAFCVAPGAGNMSAGSPGPQAFSARSSRTKPGAAASRYPP